MNQTAPVSCIPAGKMSKTKKVLDEAREIQNPELDLADKGIATFEEMPGLREFHPSVLASASSRDRQIRQLVAGLLAPHYGHLRGSDHVGDFAYARARAYSPFKFDNSRLT